MASDRLLNVKEERMQKGKTTTSMMETGRGIGTAEKLKSTDLGEEKKQVRQCVLMTRGCSTV